MVKRMYRALALVPVATLLLGSFALEAATIKSEKFNVPFEFMVQNKRMMPAGEYRVEQQNGTDIASLVNTKTGERVTFLRSAANHVQGKALVEFEETASGHALKHVS